MRLFLDANVLFSAAKSDGPMRELLTRLARAGHELCADEYVLEEARRNLALKYAFRGAGVGNADGTGGDASRRGEDPASLRHCRYLRKTSPSWKRPSVTDAGSW